ncbi:MAG: nucleotide exchange factor GrpE [Planctomycetes bacterium]|nr:nucleotide exchange factor GrpE [Planctomycetota bacterium]
MTTEDAPEPREEAAPEPQPDPAAELAKAQAQAAEYLDLAKRAKADFLNYQDRVRREREELRKYAVESFVFDLLPALESLAHTMAALRAGTADTKAVLDGVAIAEKEFLRVLAKNGITPIEAIGRIFDPLLHEAVGTVPSDQPENTVVEETRGGWKIHDRVLRPAAVRIAQKSPASEPPPTA